MSYLAIERVLIAAACVALGAGLAHAQAMYKWVDEKGVTHFSESPPPDDAKTKTKATKVEPKVIPPSSPSAYQENSDKWKAQDAEFKRRQIERDKKDEAAGKDKEKRAAACQRARQRVTFLTNTHGIFRDNPDGTRTFMTDAQRAAEMEKANDAVREYCD